MEEISLNTKYFFRKDYNHVLELQNLCKEENISKEDARIYTWLYTIRKSNEFLEQQHKDHLEGIVKDYNEEIKENLKKFKGKRYNFSLIGKTEEIMSFLKNSDKRKKTEDYFNENLAPKLGLNKILNGKISREELEERDSF